tara:strand:+ start:313 stop:540 length:228 start_codon:yes stop_codon:yes gene_type:complete
MIKLSDDDKINKIYEEIFNKSYKLSEKNDPGIVAGSLLAIGCRIYRTILSAEEYKELMDRILTTDVKPFDAPTLQ